MPCCVNCNKLCDNKSQPQDCQMFYRQLQHYLRESDHFVRPGDEVRDTILDGIEELFESEISKEQLQRYATCVICKDCLDNLRQAVNKKLRMEDSLINLHERIDKTSTDARCEYYTGPYWKDKVGRCWGCMYDFADASFKGKRHNLSNRLIEDMTLAEGIKTLLEEESQSLQELIPRKTYMCNPCFQLMGRVVRNQCLYETASASFMSKTSQNGVLASLKRGEVPKIVGIILAQTHVSRKKMRKHYKQAGADTIKSKKAKVDKQPGVDISKTSEKVDNQAGADISKTSEKGDKEAGADISKTKAKVDKQAWAETHNRTSTGISSNESNASASKKVADSDNDNQ